MQQFCIYGQEIGNERSIVSSKPYKTIITFTYAIVNDATNPGVRLIDVVPGIRYRCTPSIVVVPFRMTDTSTQALNQQLSLKILTGNIDSSVFEAKNAPWIVIPKIGEQIASLLSSSITRCSSSTSFSTADKYWCGYNTKVICLARTPCDFVVGPGCQKKQSQSGCVYGDQTSCEVNTQCEWIISLSSLPDTCTRNQKNQIVMHLNCKDSLPGKSICQE